MSAEKRVAMRHNVTVQHFDAARQRPDVALAWWIARHVSALRERAERYAIKRHRVGALLAETTVHNLVPTTGYTALANYFVGLLSENAFIKQAVGTSNQAPALGDTGLIGETAASGLARKTADAVSVINGDTAQIGPSLFVNNSGGTVTIEESGLFNTKGSMFARLLTGTKEELPGQGLLITHWIEFVAS